jgi:nucleoside 2-deoxyribosyltransferase
MKVYLAGPLFSIAERSFIDSYAKIFREAGIECFVPHEHEPDGGVITPHLIFHKDYDDGIATANALVAWLDGPMADDGTACEVGIFYGLMQQQVPWRKGILGLATDWRLTRRRDRVINGGLNEFLAGAIEEVGKICWSIEDVLEQLLAWKRELDADEGARF